MPITGGRCRKLCAQTAIVMVTRNSPMIVHAPCCSSAFSVTGVGCSLPMVKPMIVAGTSQLASEGTNRAKNAENSTIPFCQTINVVMSPKGLKAPPALAATTMLIQATVTNFRLSPPTAIATVDINRAVVRLSAIGDITNARPPVSQKMVRTRSLDRPAIRAMHRRPRVRPWH